MSWLSFDVTSTRSHGLRCWWPLYIYPAYLCWFITLDLFGFSSPSLCLCFLLVFHLLFFSFSSLGEHSCHWCRTNTEWQLKSQPSTSNPTKAARAVHGRVRIIRITGGNAHLHTTAARTRSTPLPDPRHKQKSVFVSLWRSRSSDTSIRLRFQVNG